MSFTIHVQYVTEECAHCGVLYDVARGPIFDADEGVGLYLAGMHACSEQGTVLMTIALLSHGDPEAFTIQAWPVGNENQMTFRDGAQSPWAGEAYLGAMMSAEEARNSPRRQDVFEVADLICGTVPRVIDFLSAQADSDTS